MKAYYEQSLAHIEKDIRTLYQRFATDNGLDMAAAQRLLMGGEYRVWRMDLQEYVAKINATGDKELLRELNTLAMRSRITRLDALRSETIKEMIQLSEKTERAMSRFLPSAYKDFYYRGLYEIGKTRGIRSAAGVVDGKRIEAVLRMPWSGKNYSERIWHNNAKLGETIQKSIVAAAHRGVPASDMVRDVRERMGVGTSDATRLVRTELNYVQNQAALDSIKDAGMTYYRFIATLDNRTTPICRSKDGKVFAVDDAEPGTNMPPLHPRCRSIISGSLYAEHKPRKGTRIARDEHGKNVFVPAGMRYGEWKSVYIDKKQTVAQWLRKNVASQATNTAGAAINAAGVLNAAAQNGTILVEQALRANATKLQASMSANDYNEYINLLKDNETIAPLYTQYADGISLVKNAATGGYYDHRASILEWSYPDARYTATGMHKYSTVAHEFGHYFDRCLPTSKLTFKELDAINKTVMKISDHRISFSDEFLSAMRADRTHLQKVITPSVKADFIAHASSAGVQDAVDGLFSNSRIVFGHGESYYNWRYNQIKKFGREKDLKYAYEAMGFDASNQAKVRRHCRVYEAASEAWANITAAVTCGGEDLEYVKKYLPNSYRVFMEILEKVTP